MKRPTRTFIMKVSLLFLLLNQTCGHPRSFPDSSFRRSTQPGVSSSSSEGRFGAPKNRVKEQEATHHRTDCTTLGQVWETRFQAFQEDLARRLRDEMRQSLQEEIKQNLREEMRQSLREEMRHILQDEIEQILQEERGQSLGEETRHSLQEKLGQALQRDRRQGLGKGMRRRQRKLVDQELNQSQAADLLRLRMLRQKAQNPERKEDVNKQNHAMKMLFENRKESGHVIGTTQHWENLTEQYRNRQLRSDDVGQWEPVVDQISNQVETMNSDLQALKNWADVTKQNSGTTYVRWGSRQCPSAAHLVYSGYVGGSWYDLPGSAVNYLCLPKEPVFDDHQIPPVLSPHSHVQELYGAEYQASNEAEHDKLPTCCVCDVPKSSTVMIPATNACPPGWSREYHGWLMAGASTHGAASEFICVDVDEDYVAGTETNQDGKLLYYTVTHCGSLPCPPYVNRKIVTCVVCSK